MVRSAETRETGKVALGPVALLYGGLLVLAGVLLAALAPLLRYTDSATPEGLFFQQHKTTFMPLYTLLQAQPGAVGLLALLAGGLWGGALVGLYILLLRGTAGTAALTDLLWRSRAHWAAAGVAWLGALLAFPLLSDDTLYYLLGARAWLRGFNPYLPESIAAMMADSVHSLMGGELLPFTYGPLWLYLSLLPVALSGGSFGAALLGVKLLNVALAGLCLVVLWRLLDDRPAPLRRRALLALVWNPLLWLEVAWSGHNDVAMMLWVLLALLAWRRGHPAVSMALLVCGAATKFIPLLLAPALLAALLRFVEGPARLRTLLAATGTGALALALLFGPVAWSAGPAMLTGVIRQTSLINTVFGALLRSGLDSLMGTQAAGLLMALALLGLCLGAAWLVWRGAPLPDCMIAVLLGYVLVLATWSMPWYGLWVLLLAPLARPPLREAALTATLLLPVYYVISAFPIPGWAIALLLGPLPLLLIGRIITRQPPADDPSASDELASPSL
ncbi:MAG TPA: glycosyltransferase 87 family protein [Roseiflexaceae bacterium]|nr:glycosyltransferase 87 family protein [Roseiflexaceae bacterium]